MTITRHAEHRDATELDVGDFEMSIGACLPNDYRQFLIQHNGGYPEPSAFRGGDDVINFFFGLWQKKADLNYETLAYRGFIPTGTIPIACDPGGNLILLETAAPHRGRIWFWDHEQAGNPSHAVSPLANSFTEFVASLVDIEDETLS